MTKVYNVWAKKKYRGVMFDCTKVLLSKMTWRIWQIFAHKLNNRDFILESKMAERKKSKNSKQPDRPNAVWKLDSTLEING